MTRPVRPVRVPADGVAVWTQLARPRPWLPAVLLVGAAASLGGGVLADSPTQVWGSAALAVAAVAVGGVRVTVDARGLTLSGLLGVPRYRVPLGRIAAADVVEVAPLAFGGWGLRLSRRGEVGVILRAGPGLRVDRIAGRPLVITVDDAATGAGLLRALLAQR